MAQVISTLREIARHALYRIGCALPVPGTRDEHRGRWPYAGAQAVGLVDTNVECGVVTPSG